MNRNRKNRDNSYYASSRSNQHSMGNGRTYRGSQEGSIYEDDPDSYRDMSYGDGYDDNYPSPAYSMGSGNFNMGRKVNRDTGNMFKPDYYDWEDDSFRDREMEPGYDNNYSDDFYRPEEDENLYGQPIGRYNRNYFDTRNRENRVVRHSRKMQENNKMRKNSSRHNDYSEGAGGTDWYGYYNRAFNGARDSNYDSWLQRRKSQRKYAGTLRRKRPYL